MALDQATACQGIAMIATFSAVVRLGCMPHHPGKDTDLSTTHDRKPPAAGQQVEAYMQRTLEEQWDSHWVVRKDMSYDTTSAILII